MAFKLVSCDGGGIRGYLTCVLLKGLHDETGFLDKADGFAGTSTGGLISVVLADGRSRDKNMADVVDNLISVYRDDADRIFRENERSLLDVAVHKVLGQFGLGGGPGVAAAQFTASGIWEIGQELVADRTLGSISDELVLAVTTVCLHLNDQIGCAPFTLTNKNINAGPWLDLSDVKLIDIAMATSAAPTFFPPHRIDTTSADYGYFADGGVFANNPVLNGMNVAIAANEARDHADIEAISFGTGQQPMRITEDTLQNPDDWGLLKWFGVTSHAPPGALLDLSLTTSAENQYWVAHLVLGDRLARVNPQLPKTVGLASIEPENFELMDEAFRSALKSDGWSQAKRIVGNW